MNKSLSWVEGKIHNLRKERIMGILNKRIGSVFLKEESGVSEFMDKMHKLSEKADGKLKKEIDKQIKLAKYGEVGERNIAYELKNSGMDMYILHDIYLEYGDLSAQIDYMVFTRKCIYVIECKNLYGDIEIDGQGNFVRSYELYGKKIKEGFYSPVTQNERHLNVIKEVRKASKNLLLKGTFEKNFSNNYVSIICMANSKSVLNVRFAPKDIKEKVIKVDQLIKFINDNDKKSDKNQYSDKNMRETAEFFLNAAVKSKSDYSKIYEEMVELAGKNNVTNVESVNEEVSVQEEKTEINDEQETATATNGEINIEENTNEDKLPDDDMEVVNDGKKICARCGAEMVMRVAAKGKHQGEKFYGCSRYPKCRYVENVMKM